MPKKSGSTEKKESRKNDILTCALKTFCKKGYAGTTIDDIVESAGCSHGLFYHYFKSKKDIFNAVIERRKHENTELIMEQIKNASSSEQKLRIIIDSIYTRLYTDENYAYYFYLFISQCFLHRDGVFKPKKKGNHPILVLEDIFSDGQKNGEFTNKYTPRECNELFISLIQGATLGYVIAPEEIRKKMRLPKPDFILDIYLKGGKNEG